MKRRNFLTTMLASAAGIIVPGSFALGKESNSILSTEHFWYKKAPLFPYIDSQNGNKSFGFTEKYILLSEDNSHNWPYRLEFWDAENITFSHVFKNGNVLFATQNRLYLSTDKLQSVREIVVKSPDGSDYLPHIPKNPQFPGWYYIPLCGVNSWDVNGKEMLVWGNYANVLGGAVPVNIYYSADNGESVKIAYSFGQNPRFRDNGESGGRAIGNLLGNPDNPSFCRHIHCVSYNPKENAFYASTGDGQLPEGKECKWIRGTYSPEEDNWTWETLIEDDFNTRFKSGGINFVDGMMYFASDANGKEPYDRGIFKCGPKDLTDKSKHELLFQPHYESANMIIHDNIIIAAHYATASPWDCGIIYSPDLGKSWYEYDLKELGKRSAMRIQRPNKEGWYRMDIREGWLDRAEVLFIKPKI